VDEETLRAWLALADTAALAGARLRELLAAHGSAAGVLRRSRAELARALGETAAAALCNGPDPARLAAVLAWQRRPACTVLTLDDARYPELLRETPDPPLLLYAQGRIELLGEAALAIVGSRNATAQGMRTAEAFARVLSAHGLTIVSGMALGIDAAAHRGALAARASSIAVLGCGIDVVYPRRNGALYQELAAQGLLLSEFALGAPPLGRNFPRRNRIIAGMSRGCLVVEAALASGSLVTARLAADMGRDVFAIPGSIHSPLAKGCHQLIKQGAKLVDDAADILDELGIAHGAAASPALEASAAPVSGDAASVLTALGHDACDLDALAERTRLSVARLLAALTQLELAARLERMHDRTNSRV
jgi:DNA processing protein